MGIPTATRITQHPSHPRARGWTPAVVTPLSLPPAKPKLLDQVRLAIRTLDRTQPWPNNSLERTRKKLRAAQFEGVISKCPSVVDRSCGIHYGLLLKRITNPTLHIDRRQR